MPLRSVIAVLVLVLAVASAALAGTIDDGIADSTYLAYGKTFGGYIRRITTTGTDGQLEGGSCVLIADRWALTAAHVIHKRAAGVVEGGPAARVIVSMHPHPQFDGQPWAYDIGLIQVARGFGESWYPPVADRAPSEGATVMIAGCGATGLLSTGSTSPSDGRLRAGTLRLTGTEGTLLTCRLARGTPLPIGLAYGDSGGGMFHAGELVAINSCFIGRPAVPRWGNESGHTDATRFREWIAATIAAESQEEDRTAAP